MSLRKQYSKSTAYINEFNKENNKKVGSVTRNCIAVPVVTIPHKKTRTNDSHKAMSFMKSVNLLKGIRIGIHKSILSSLKPISSKIMKYVFVNIKNNVNNIMDNIINNNLKNSLENNLKRSLKSTTGYIIKNINMIVNNLQNIEESEKITRYKEGFTLICKTYFALIMKHRKRIVLVASSFVIVFFVGMAIAYQTRQTGYEVFMGETSVGVVHKKEDFDQCFKRVQSDLNSIMANGVIIDNQPTFAEKKFWNGDFSSQKAMEKNIKSIVNVAIPGYAVIVDGKQMGILKDRQAVEDILNRIKEQYKPASSNVTVEFNKEIKIENVEVKLKDLNDSEQLYATLSGLEDSIKTYTIKKNDTLWDIAIDHRMAVEEIARINPDISERLQPGDEIKLSVPNPILGVKTREKIEYTEGIEFDIAEVKDPDNYIGRRTIVQRGANGEKKIEAEIIRINGIETGKEVINELVLVQPKVQTEKVGTKPTPPKFATGKFGRPVYGVLTSRFGSRWGRMHSGIDFSASIGTPVNASDGGRVIFAGREGAYGNLIKIAHDNEYITYYGHLNKISVKNGQRVAKGELIGTVGNTGRSTGPHLHFEVRKNDTAVNPLNYLNR